MPHLTERARNMYVCMCVYTCLSKTECVTRLFNVMLIHISYLPPVSLLVGLYQRWDIRAQFKYTKCPKLITFIMMPLELTSVIFYSFIHFLLISRTELSFYSNLSWWRCNIRVKVDWSLVNKKVIVFLQMDF